MNARGLPIPPLLVEMIREGRLKRERGSWQLSQEFDAYGNIWESELGQVHESAIEIETASSRLPIHFPIEVDGTTDEWVSAPGHIPYINSFDLILQFAVSGDGAPFCLDYRENLFEPSVIWWDDVYWRKVAPTFAEFIRLFDFTK